MDMEILIPIDKEIKVPANYRFNKKFLLTNALMIKHYGNPTYIESTTMLLNKYIKDHNLDPITTAYNVMPQQKSPTQMSIDIYIGISPNLL